MARLLIHVRYGKVLFLCIIHTPQAGVGRQGVLPKRVWQKGSEWGSASLDRGRGATKVGVVAWEVRWRICIGWLSLGEGGVHFRPIYEKCVPFVHACACMINLRDLAGPLESVDLGETPTEACDDGDVLAFVDFPTV